MSPPPPCTSCGSALGRESGSDADATALGTALLPGSFNAYALDTTAAAAGVLTLSPDATGTASEAVREGGSGSGSSNERSGGGGGGLWSQYETVSSEHSLAQHLNSLALSDDSYMLQSPPAHPLSAGRIGVSLPSAAAAIASAASQGAQSLFRGAAAAFASTLVGFEDSSTSVVGDMDPDYLPAAAVPPVVAAESGDAAGVAGGGWLDVELTPLRGGGGAGASPPVASFPASSSAAVSGHTLDEALADTFPSFPLPPESRSAAVGKGEQEEEYPVYVPFRASTAAPSSSLARSGVGRATTALLQFMPAAMAHAAHTAKNLTLAAGGVGA